MNAPDPSTSLSPAIKPDNSICCQRCSTIAYGADRFCACCGMQLARTWTEDASHPLENFCTRCGGASVATAPLSAMKQRRQCE